MTRRRVRAAGEVLSLREAQIYEALGRGETHGAVADRLSLSVSTIGYHLGRVQQRLHVGSTPAVIVILVAAGVLTSNEFPAQLTGNLTIDPGFIPD